MQVPKVKELLRYQRPQKPIGIPKPVVPPPRLPDRFIPSPDLGQEPPEFSVPRIPIDLGDDWPAGIPRWPTPF